jgi:isoleucyl-tRNA synthetase
MAKYPEYKHFSLPEIDKEMLSVWQNENTFQKSIDTREGNPQFTFYEGPPSANGLPGIHHVMARTVKDIFCRYKTLKGFQVKRKGGWDTHGLPIELQVEKSLGITKEDIGKKLSIKEYNEACRKDVLKFKDKWDDVTTKMGYWVDLDNPYVTFENEYIESVWHLLKRLHDKNYLYKGFTIQPYSPMAGTGLSSHELNLPGCYRKVMDTTCVAQFKVKQNEKSAFLFENEEENVNILAWTTTPWTLPSNAALAVGENIVYVKVKTFNAYTHQPVSVVLAKDLAAKYFPAENQELLMEDYKSGDKKIPYQFVGEWKGKALEGIEYEQLLPYVQPETPAFRVIIGDFVTTTDGTGIVHIAPTFGADDFRVARQNDIPPIMVTDEDGQNVPLVDKRGRFVAEVTDFALEYVKGDYLTGEEMLAALKKQGRDKYLSVDERIVIKLKTENKCFKAEKYEHDYPHCWRTDKPILYYPLDSWFVKTTASKARMAELNKTIKWKPEATGTGRFGNWLENLVDWNLSRSRYWGIPLPIWRTEDRKEEVCIGSMAELRAEGEKAVAAGFMTAEKVEELMQDLHKPYADEWILVSPSGKEMKRESDLIDVWFDSGAMPFAQWHYPFENAEIFKQSFPADFIAEGVDQTRGWFFTLHAIAVMLEDSVAFKNVIANGLVLFKDGTKMSKSRGNVVNPFETMEEFGADATRWYMVGNASPWENLKFDTAGIKESQRKFFGTLYNTYNFFALYANIDNFVYGDKIPVSERAELDRWVISVLNTLIQKVDSELDDYEPTRAIRLIEDFLNEHLSNWYVRLSRRRFWKGELNQDKIAAYQTLYECLHAVSILMSPFAPFYSDKLYRDLTGEESVHLANFPQVNENERDTKLEERMEMAQSVCSLIHSIRKKTNHKVRQPLQKAMIPIFSEETAAQFELVKDIILSEVNIKELAYISEKDNTVIVKKAKPNFKLLGTKLGPKMKEVGALVAAFTQDEIQGLERNGSKVLTLSDSNTYELLLAEVEIISQDVPGWAVATDGKFTVALDISISPDLQNEGIAREWVNRIQNLRKSKGFEVTDSIRVVISSSEVWDTAILQFKEYICSEVLCKDLRLTANIITEGDVVEVFDCEGLVQVEVFN